MGDFAHELGSEVVEMLREGEVAFSYLLPIFKNYMVSVLRKEGIFILFGVCGCIFC